jgi:hypothetical protein
MESDIETYKRRTGRLDWADLDLAAVFADQSLQSDVLRCLRYMHDVEFHTVCYLRDLLLTPAHDDPENPPFSASGSTRSSGTERPSPTS